MISRLYHLAINLLQIISLIKYEYVENHWPQHKHLWSFLHLEDKRIYTFSLLTTLQLDSNAQAPFRHLRPGQLTFFVKLQ